MRPPVAALTGGTGFLGSHIAHALVARGWRVRLLVRPQSVAAAPSESMRDLVVGDLGDASALQRLVDGADVLIHAAGLVKARHDSAYWATNTTGSARLATTMRRWAPSAKFVLVSSIAARVPHLSSYAASKRAAEEAVVAEAGHTAVVVLRPCAIYGPGDRETLHVFRAARGPVLLLPREPGKICLLHAADLADAVAAVAASPELRGTYEVTDRRYDGYAWTEIVAAMCAALSTSPPVLRIPARALHALAPLLHIARLSRRFDILTPGKLREILHDDWSSDPLAQLPPSVWSAHVDLQNGLRQTAEWYAQHGWLPVPSPAQPAPLGRHLGQGQC